MRTIQFPNAKKNKKLLDYDMTVLPSPSYTKSHRTLKDESIKKGRSNIFERQKAKLRHETMLMPTVNISLDQKVDKKKKGHHKLKNNQKMKHDQEK